VIPILSTDCFNRVGVLGVCWPCTLFRPVGVFSCVDSISWLDECVSSCVVFW